VVEMAGIRICRRIVGETVDAEQRQEAIRIASSVLHWADRVIDI
jgi:hypothetical protein